MKIDSFVRVVQKRPFLRTFCHGLWWRHQIRLISATSTLFRLDGSKADLKVLKIGFDWPWQKTFSTSFSQKEFLVHFITISSGTSFEKYEIEKRGGCSKSVFPTLSWKMIREIKIQLISRKFSRNRFEKMVICNSFSRIIFNYVAATLLEIEHKEGKGKN